jgi:hypothetical protein
MSNTNAAGTVWNCPNYVGELFIAGSAHKYPLLNMMGGLSGGQVRTVGDFQFPLAVPYDLEAAAQPAITETASLTAPTAWTYVRGQDVNTVQIFQRQASLSYAKLSVTGQVMADTTTYRVDSTSKNPVPNEMDFQIMAHMKQVSRDADYTFLNGAYQQATSAAVAAKTRGVVTACSTSAVAAGSVDLSKDLIDQLLRTMSAAGAEFENPVIFVNAFQKQQLSKIYGYAPTDRNVGGVNIKQIETDFAVLGVAYASNMTTSVLAIIDVAYCKPVFLPVPNKGLLFYEELSKTGAGESGQIYGQIGIDYGPEEYHGKITGLTTS